MLSSKKFIVIKPLWVFRDFDYRITNMREE